MTTDPKKFSRQIRRPAITAASLLCFLHGLGWPIGLVPSIRYMIQNRALRVIETPFGQIRGLSGPFEVLGIDAMILLALLWAAINLVWILAGVWLWKSRRKGGVLAVSLLAVSAVFWFGFALPFPPIIGLLLAALLATNWSSLR